jgi:hypothetical protein
MAQGLKPGEVIRRVHAERLPGGGKLATHTAVAPLLRDLAELPPGNRSHPRVESA